MFGKKRREFITLLGGAAAWPVGRARSSRSPLPKHGESDFSNLQVAKRRCQSSARAYAISATPKAKTSFSKAASSKMQIMTLSLPSSSGSRSTSS